MSLLLKSVVLSCAIFQLKFSNCAGLPVIHPTTGNGALRSLTFNETVIYNKSIGTDTNDTTNGRQSTVGPSASLNFLRKFGYLEPLGSNHSETLYSEERIVEAVRLMQKFGGLSETGKLDSDTLSLITKPRCGVPDVISPNSRQKRFAFGSKGWNKRRLTYRIDNWSPKLSQGEVSSDVRKAMDIWANYAHLNFVNKSGNSDVDIVISFSRGYHADRYPFDGPGGTLAHAFFPQSHGGLAGDVHFDADENWYSPSSGNGSVPGGISFLDVALHELGHSLGLAHSHIRTSVMFPYYQNPEVETEPRLDYDDIMALYQLYIVRNIEDDGYDTSDTPSTTAETEVTSKTPSETSTTTSMVPVTNKYYPEDDYPIASTTQRPEEPKTDKPGRLPDICNGQFDTVAYLRNEIFVFSGQNMWRFHKRGQLAGGIYPAKTSRLFPVLQEVGQIDAAFERESDGNIIFISGKSYWTFDGSREGDTGPHSITDFGLPSHLEKLDAAFVWGKNKMTYFFKDNMYWKYNDTINTIEDGYPRDIKSWRGVPERIDSVIRYKDGKTYFFKDKEFWKFDDYMVHTEEGYPRNTLTSWFNC